MIEFVFKIAAKIGYTHPLHPATTHLPVGLVIGGFVFALAAWLLRMPSLAQTARHCLVLALITLLPAALLGYMDWQHFYAGAWLFPIKMKLTLAGLLLILLLYAVIIGWQAKTWSRNFIMIYALCLVTVIGIGYFGGELVYGRKAPAGETEGGLVGEGATLFDQSCSLCHHADKTETKIGPGLKGLFKRESLPVSGRDVTDANIRGLLKEPFEEMPPFADLPEDKVEALIAFLKTL